MINDTAWNLLWSVENADAQSPGCAEHGEPDCLCDVDVSLTADLEWNQAPRDLCLVETIDDLFYEAVEMLLRAEMSANRRTIRHAELTQLSWITADDEALDTIIAALADDPTKGCQVLETELGFHRNAIQAIRHMLGCRGVSGGHRMPHCDTVAQLAREGLPAPVIVEEMARRGVKITLPAVQQTLSRRGIKSVHHRTWQRQQHWPKVKRLLDQGLTKADIGRELGISHKTVARLVREAA